MVSPCQKISRFSAKNGQSAVPDRHRNSQWIPFAYLVRSNQVPMTETTLLIKRMPADLKDWLASEAQRNHRSMNNGDVLSR